MHVFDFLESAADVGRPAVCVLTGNEAFLKRLAKQTLRDRLFGPDAEASFTHFDGETAVWRDVNDELCTLSLFGGGGPRAAMVDTADDFVSKFRDKLEEYAAKSKAPGVLVLDVESFPSNTNLFKIVEKYGLTIECRPPETARGKTKFPDEGRIRQWIVAWGASRHEAKLSADAARALLDLIGPEFGMLDQELAKLALFVKPGETIGAELVGDVVGGWRTKTTWELLDAVQDGNAAEALRQFDRLLQSGEELFAMFGPFSWSLRRFAAATRIFQQAERQGQRIPLAVALEQAGFSKWPVGNLEKGERQLIQIGRERGAKINRWLMETDLALKGSHSTPARSRFILEQFFVKLAKELGPKRKASGG